MVRSELLAVLIAGPVFHTEPGGAKKWISHHQTDSKRRFFGYLSALAAGAVVLSVTGMTAAGAVSPASAQRPAASSNPACTTSDPAWGRNPLRGFCRYLSGRQGVVQVALFNRYSGKTCLLSNGNDTQYTASIVKVDIEAKWLHDYQRRGTKILDGIPYSIQYLMQRMIENSDNAAATALFYFKGGCGPLMRFNNMIPLTQTKVGCETPTYYGWGNTHDHRSRSGEIDEDHRLRRAR